MYMRPAEDKDAAGIAEIYNYYIKHSILTEDQEPVTAEQIKFILGCAKNEKMPLIVAIKGKEPSMTDAQGRFGTSNQPMLPAVETVIGFASAERHNYGWWGKSYRARATCNLQFYVHPQYTRKRVGRSLVDRLLHCLTLGYAYKNEGAWINPRNDPVYNSEGSGMWHQMLINIAVEKSADPKKEPEVPYWLRTFLYDKCAFYFKQHFLMKSIARTSPDKGPCHFVDIAVWQCESASEQAWGTLH